MFIASPTLRKATFTVLAVVLGLALIEGLSALLLGALGGDGAEPPIAERSHTRYDEELGWVHVPSQQVVDLYGPGRTLTTNSQGFRADHDFAPSVPEGRVRLLCSGDSFTLGWGVNDANTWCAALERLDPRIQTVNMGQGGYGIDQAYLWARRESDTLEHQVHLFAFISEDLQRMRYDRFSGYGKPTLRLPAGGEAGGQAPVANGVPVPRPERLKGPWWSQTRTARLVLRVARRSVEVPPEPQLALSDAARIAVAAITSLHGDHEQRGSRLVAVWLPTIGEYVSRNVDPLRRTVVGNLRAAGVRTIDLSSDFLELSPAEVDRLFLTQDDVVFPESDRHYSEQGNEFVARALWRRLQYYPEFTRAEASD